MNIIKSILVFAAVAVTLISASVYACPPSQESPEMREAKRVCQGGLAPKLFQECVVNEINRRKR